MKIRVKVPKLGLTIEEVTVAEWEKSPGDTLKAEEILVTVEADKANYEITAPAGGTLMEISAQEGDVVEVGGVLAVINTD